MAFLEKNNVPTYETFIQQELKKHGDDEEAVVARALIKLPVDTSQWLLLGGSAIGTAQTCILAITNKKLLMIPVKQDLVEAPAMMESSVAPIEKVKLIKFDNNWLDHSFVLEINDKVMKLQFVHLEAWSTLKDVIEALPKK